MARKSKQNYAETSWNPITGCVKYSDGCLNCYAQRIAKRLNSIGQEKYKHGFKPTLHEEIVTKPLDWKRPHFIFVCSMSDLFQKDVPTEFIKSIFETINRAHWHNFQILTKRAERLSQLAPELNWPSNLWVGVTVESEKYTFRIDHLKKVPATVKYLCIEPLLGKIDDLPLEGIDWVILGGESGYGCRPVKEEWIVSIRDQCIKAGVPFYFKQWGGVKRDENGCLLQGEYWHQTPVVNESLTLPLF